MQPSTINWKAQLLL